MNDLKHNFESECERFFKQVIKKHESLKFRFKLSLFHKSSPDAFVPSAVNKNSSSQQQQREYLKKVQFLKLCDLNKIYTLFKNKQYDEANTYVKNSTQEIVFNAVKLTDDYEPHDGSSNSRPKTSSVMPSVVSSAKQPPNPLEQTVSDMVNDDDDLDIDDLDDDDDDDDDVMLDEYGGVTNSGGVSTVAVVSSSMPATSDLVEDVRLKNRLIKLKSEKSPSGVSSNQTSINFYDDLVATLTTWSNAVRVWFWRHVPEEDFLLAVIVPITIVVSLFVLTIVVACVLHMFNKGNRFFKNYS